MQVKSNGLKPAQTVLTNVKTKPFSQPGPDNTNYPKSNKMWDPQPLYQVFEKQSIEELLT